MRRSAILLSALLLSTPAAAAEIACDGPFAPDSSEARLKDAFGAENVVTGEVDGPEGSTIIATTVFPNDPDKKMVFGWWDEEAMAELSYVELAPGDTAFGVSRGMSVDEVEALNGEPFTMTGLWWDYGGYAGFQSGKLADLPGGCYLSLSFDTTVDVPDGLNVDSISGDQQVPSSEPLLDQLAVKVVDITLGYPFPGMEEEGDGEDGESMDGMQASTQG